MAEREKMLEHKEDLLGLHSCGPVMECGTPFEAPVPHNLESFEQKPFGSKAQRDGKGKADSAPNGKGLSGDSVTPACACVRGTAGCSGLSG